MLSVLDVSYRLWGCTRDSVAGAFTGAAEVPFEARAAVPSAATTRKAAAMAIVLMTLFMLTPPSAVSLSSPCTAGLSLQTRWAAHGQGSGGCVSAEPGTRPAQAGTKSSHLSFLTREATGSQDAPT